MNETLDIKETSNYEHTYDNNRLNIGLDIEFKSVSKSFITDFIFDNGDGIRVWCNDWSDEVTRERNWPDALYVKIEFYSWAQWLKYESHK